MLETERCAALGKKGVMAVYGPDVESGGVDLETAIYDLVADLLHLARLNDFDTDRILEQATMHFQAEVWENQEATN